MKKLFFISQTRTDSRFCFLRNTSQDEAVEAPSGNALEQTSANLREFMDDVAPEITPEQQRDLSRRFERLVTQIDSRVDTRELREQVSRARNRQDFVRLGNDIDRLLRDQEIEEFQSELDQLRAQVDPEYQALQEIQNLRAMFDRIPSWLRPEGSAAGMSRDDLRAIIERFYVFEPNTNSYRARTAMELARQDMNNAQGIFGKAWAFLKGLGIGLFARNRLVSAESAVTLGLRTEQQVEALENEYGDVVEQVGDTAEDIAQGAATTREAWRNNPELALARREADRMMRTFESRHHTNLDRFTRAAANNRDTASSMRRISTNSGGFMREVRSNPVLQQELIRQQNNGQDIGRRFGVNVRRAGGIFLFSISVQAMRAALQERDPSVFIDNMANADLWTETIPGVGSWRSGKRLFSNNGDPLWAKGLDFGINIVGDVAIVAGAVIGILGTPAGSAALAGGAAGLKTAASAALRGAVRGGTRVAANASIRGAGRAIASSVGRQAVRRQRVLNEFGEQVYRVAFRNPQDGAEMVVEAATKSDLNRRMRAYGFQRSGRQFVNQGLVRQTLSTGVRWEAATAGFETGMNRVVENMDLEERIVEVGTRQLRESLSPTRMALFEAVSGRSVNFLS